MVRAALAIARTPGRRRAVRSLLRDPARSNREVAGEVRTGHMLVTAVRHEMEAAGLIRLYRSTSRAGIRRATPLQVRIRAALLADPARSNRVVAGEAETNHLRVTAVRHAMEAAGLIPVYRARGGPRK
jgi:hypothetical protein